MSESNHVRHQDWEPDCKVYIRGLRSDSTQRQLEDAFARYGKVVAVWIAVKPPGYAFLLMGSNTEAQRCCARLNNTKIGGYRMKVEMATGLAREEKTSDGGDRSALEKRNRYSTRKNLEKSRSPARHNSSRKRWESGSRRPEKRASSTRRERPSRRARSTKIERSPRRRGSTRREISARRARTTRKTTSERKSTSVRINKDTDRQKESNLNSDQSMREREKEIKDVNMSTESEVRGGSKRMRTRSRSGSQGGGGMFLMHPDPDDKTEDDGYRKPVIDVEEDQSSLIMADELELDYEGASDDGAGDVVNALEDNKEAETKPNEDENIPRDQENRWWFQENRNLNLRIEELLQENVMLADKQRHLKREKETLEKVKQELLRKVEKVKQENDCLKQKNTQLEEGMLLLRAKLQGAVEVVDSMEVLQDEVSRPTSRRERGEGK